MDMDEISNPPFIPNDDGLLTLQDQRVGFGKRFGASILDGFVMLILTIILYYSAGDVFPSLSASLIDMQFSTQSAFGEGAELKTIPFMQQMAAMQIEAFVVGIVISLMEVFFAASVGKMLLSIQIARADGHKASLGTLASRWLLKSGFNILSLLAYTIVSFELYIGSRILGFVVVLGALMMLGEKKTALHDIICGTAVYQVRDVVDNQEHDALSA